MQEGEIAENEREEESANERAKEERRGVQQSPARRTFRFHLHFCCTTRARLREDEGKDEDLLSRARARACLLFLGSCGIFIDNYNARELISR